MMKRRIELEHKILITYLLTKAIVLISLIVFITCAAIHFNKTSILWFYIIPGLFLDSHIKIKEDKNENENEN